MVNHGVVKISLPHLKIRKEGKEKILSCSARSCDTD